MAARAEPGKVTDPSQPSDRIFKSLIILRKAILKAETMEELHRLLVEEAPE